MNIDEQLHSLGNQQYGRKVEVTGRVMAEVDKLQVWHRPQRQTMWRYIASGAIAVSHNRTFEDEQIGTMLSSLYDNNSYQTSSTIEDVILSEYIYE